MLTPGPQKPRYCINPRFRALINRFENNSITMARTPVTKREPPVSTPPMGEHPNMPRAINFKDESPAVSTESNTDVELYKTCVEYTQESKMNSAISSLSANIAGSLQNCITSILKTDEQETEIQFKFIITKKTVSVKRIEDEGNINEKSSEVVGDTDSNKDNIWSSVAKAVKNVFWGEKGDFSGIYGNFCPKIGVVNTTLQLILHFLVQSNLVMPNCKQYNVILVIAASHSTNVIF